MVTHPGFKDKDGNLRVKAVYLAGNTKVPQEKVTVTKTDHTGASTQVHLLPGIVTDPKVILDTLKVKDGIEFASSQGTAMESNTSDNTFKYTLITVKTATAQFKSFLGMPVIGWTLHVKPLEEPAEVFAWADDNATMKNEGIFVKGTSEVSMGDWNTPMSARQA